MKLMKYAILLATSTLLFSCEWAAQRDTLEVYFGIVENNATITESSVFFYEGENALNFTLSDEVFIRFDFLYIPDNQSNNEPLIVEFVFDDSDAFFFSPIIINDVENTREGNKLIYLLPLNVNTYTSFYFSLEVLEATVVIPQLRSPILMEHISSNQLNEDTTIDSQNIEVDVIKKGKILSFNQLIFQ